MGPSATDALEEGTDNPMTIIGDTATFTEPLADNVGVGDAIQYDDDDDGDIDSNDSIAFITERISNSKFKISNSSGGLPTEVASDTDWSIFRAYTALFHAEAGSENDGLDDDLETFESWSGGKDIVTAGEQWNIACYGGGTDTLAVTFAGWTTGAGNYIKVFTPVDESEVGTSQRHDGKWNSDAYKLQISNEHGITIQEEYMWFDGIQVYIDSVDDNATYTFWVNTTGVSDVRLSNSIIRGITTPGDDYNFFGGFTLYDAGSGKTRVWNNIFYDFITDAGSNGWGMTFEDTDFVSHAHNNTIEGVYNGVFLGEGTVVLKNNNVQNASSPYTDMATGLSSLSEYNVADSSITTLTFGATWESGTTSSAATNKLIDSGADFSSVTIGSLACDDTNCTNVTAIDSSTQLSVADDYFTSAENYAVYKNRFGVTPFVDEANDDFHLAGTDDVALAKGADVSSDPYIKVTDDIDGDKREGNFSIGADEGTPTKIYRSVGPGNTTALATGEDNDMTISGSTATFDEPLPDRVGVGDAIQYDDDSDGDIDANDSIVFIHGRTSSTEYTVKTATGAEPTAVSDDNDWSIFRAYTSLANWESGDGEQRN